MSDATMVVDQSALGGKRLSVAAIGAAAAGGALLALALSQVSPSEVTPVASASRALGVLGLALLAVAVLSWSFPACTSTLIAELPLLYLSQKYLSVNLWDIVYITPVTVALIMVSLRAAVRLGSISFRATDLAFMALLVIALAPTIWARAPALAMVGYGQWIVEPVAAFFLVRAAIHQPDDIMLIVRGVRWSLIALVALMAIQVIQAGGPSQAILDTTSRTGQPLSGGYAEPSEVAAILIKIAPWYATIALTNGSRRDFAFAGGIVALTLLMITRYTTILLTLELALLGILLMRSGLLSRRQRVAVTRMFLAGLLIVGLLGPLYVARINGADFGRASQSDPNIFTGLPIEGNLLTYIARALTSIEAVEAYPFGIGAFNAGNVNLPLQYETVAGHPLPTFESLLPFFTIAIHFGVVAAIVAALGIGVVWLRLISAYRRASAACDRILALGFIATIFPGLVLGTFAPVVTWLGLLSDSGGVALGQTLFNGQAIWSFIVLALAISFTDVVASPQRLNPAFARFR